MTSTTRASTAASTSASTRRRAPGSAARSASTCSGTRCDAPATTAPEASAADARLASPTHAPQATAMRQEYGQFCPVALASEVLAERWTLLVVRELLAGSRRFNDIRRGVPRLSPTLRRDRLRTLERAGIVERAGAGGARGPDYQLTTA